MSQDKSGKRHTSFAADVVTDKWDDKSANKTVGCADLLNAEESSKEVYARRIK
ncbi:MAG: hypothetical protein ACP5M0_00815 [Desulfomonilaceae bacterium]